MVKEQIIKIKYSTSEKGISKVNQIKTNLFRNNWKLINFTENYLYFKK